jgi:predicted  nucleic acid-binding Zn-ribbon protein
MEVAIMSKAETLYRLQTIDWETDGRNRRLKEVKAILGGNEELERARRALQDGEKELSCQRAKLRDQELEIRSLNSKIASVEDRLYGGRVKNPKELGNLQDEVRYLKRRKGELEDQVLETMIEVEDSEANVMEQREGLAHLEEEWQETQIRLSAEREELMTRLRQLKAKRAKLQKTIEVGDLALYEDLRRRKGGQAVALLEGELCQACRVTLPTSKAQQARQGKVLTLCGSCERILYVER